MAAKNISEIMKIIIPFKTDRESQTIHEFQVILTQVIHFLNFQIQNGCRFQNGYHLYHKILTHIIDRQLKSSNTCI